MAHKRCQKRQMDKVEAMIALAQADAHRKMGSVRKSGSCRQERNMYYCNECKAYHVTSKRRNESED